MVPPSDSSSRGFKARSASRSMPVADSMIDHSPPPRSNPPQSFLPAGSIALHGSSHHLPGPAPADVAHQRTAGRSHRCAWRARIRQRAATHPPAAPVQVRPPAAGPASGRVDRHHCELSDPSFQLACHGLHGRIRSIDQQVLKCGSHGHTRTSSAAGTGSGARRLHAVGAAPESRPVTMRAARPVRPARGRRRRCGRRRRTAAAEIRPARPRSRPWRGRCPRHPPSGPA